MNALKFIVGLMFIHRWPIIYTTLCEGNFYYMKRGIQPNLQRQWVYYTVTDGGRDIMFASISELTSDALYIIKK